MRRRRPALAGLVIALGAGCVRFHASAGLAAGTGGDVGVRVGISVGLHAGVGVTGGLATSADARGVATAWIGELDVPWPVDAAGRRRIRGAVRAGRRTLHRDGPDRHDFVAGGSIGYLIQLRRTADCTILAENEVHSLGPELAMDTWSEGARREASVTAALAYDFWTVPNLGECK